MAFDGDGTITFRRYRAPSTLSASLAKLKWTGPPNPIPSSWIANPESPFEAPALQALSNSQYAALYNFYANVPLSEIFSIKVRGFLAHYRSNPHWTAGKKSIRRGALHSLRNQIGKKQVDILVCRKNGVIVAGVEIDGPHHATEPQQTWDLSKSMLFASLGIPLLRVATKPLSKQPWTPIDDAFFLQQLRTARLALKAFVANPTIATMQLHKP